VRQVILEPRVVFDFQAAQPSYQIGVGQRSEILRGQFVPCPQPEIFEVGKVASESSDDIPLRRVKVDRAEILRLGLPQKADKLAGVIAVQDKLAAQGEPRETGQYRQMIFINFN
jgi:hypothetical protein